MARSTHIWIVGIPEEGVVLWAGTVKNELVSWLEKQKPYHTEDWYVLRAPDGKEFEDRDVPILSVAAFLDLNNG